MAKTAEGDYDRGLCVWLTGTVSEGPKEGLNPAQLEMRKTETGGSHQGLPVLEPCSLLLLRVSPFLYHLRLTGLEIFWVNQAQSHWEVNT